MMASYSTSWQPCLHGTQFCLFLDENLTGIDNKIWLNLKFCYGNRHFGRGDASRNGGHPITLSNDRMAKEINFSLRSCMKLSQWCPISLSFLPNQNSSPTSWPETPRFFFGNSGPPPAAPAAHANRQSLLQQHRSWFQQAVKERLRKPRPLSLLSLKVTSFIHPKSWLVLVNDVWPISKFSSNWLHLPKKRREHKHALGYMLGKPQ